MVTIRVPATTANLGPGYDVLGLALAVWMQVNVEPAERFSIEVHGEGEKEIKCDETNLIVQSCAMAFKKAGKPFPPLAFTVHSQIPFGCGCGSSSAAAVAGYAAGMQLCGLTLGTTEREELLEVIAELEGHPDNAAPAIYGGCQLGYRNTAGHTSTVRIPFPPNLSIVIFSPSKKMKQSTHVTRGLVADTIKLHDAVFNISRTAMIVAALSSNNTRILRECLGEKIHQDARAARLFPHFNKCVQAAMRAGAAYTFLSGAGPSVCAFVPGRVGEPLLQPPSERIAEVVAERMVAAARAVGVDGRAVITHATDVGAHFVGTCAVSDNVVYLGSSKL